MYTKIISAVVSFVIISAFLTSCSQDQSNQPSPDQTVSQDQGTNQSPDQTVGQPSPDGSGRGRSMSGSGGYRWKSGSGSMMQKLSPEDQAVFQQMIQAVRSGDTATVQKLQAQLRAKYPDLRFGSGSRRSWSGSRMPNGSGANN